jgi:hypothetical protein
VPDSLKTGLAVLVALLFAAAAAYYAVAADGHPRVKHVLLLAGLAVVSGLVAWFTLPPRDTTA